MPRTVTLTGLVVAKSGTIDVRQYVTDQIYKLLGFTVIRPQSISHSHSIANHAGHSHTLILADSNNANAPVYAIGVSNGKLIGSKSDISATNATDMTSDLTHTVSKEDATLLARETKTVINNGFPTSTVPSDDSVALVDAKTIKIGNDLTDSLIGTETVVIRYISKTEYPIPT